MDGTAIKWFKRDKPDALAVPDVPNLTASDPIDAARLNLLLNELRLPAIKHLWYAFTERADKEGWPAARLLSALAEHEIAERGQRRIERHLAEAHLPPGKTLSGFDFDAVPNYNPRYPPRSYVPCPTE